ncbi:MAG: iron-containing alcohol dehydrogenase, partial [Pseudomonadota bacterium]
MTFGVGRIAELPAIVDRVAKGPVLVVADAFLEDLGVTAQLAVSLRTAGIECDIAAVIAGEPKEAVIDALRARLKAAGAQVV